jgi:hypothetical protein
MVATARNADRVMDRMNRSLLDILLSAQVLFAQVLFH